MNTETIAYKGIDFEVEFTYYPGSPEVRYLSNGDPGYPEELESFEFHSITHKGDEFIQFFDGKDFREIENILCDMRNLKDS
jgi:hypothetical protein